jgi:SAM-dependent methyltransferase
MKVFSARCILCGTDAAGCERFPGILQCPSCRFVFANLHLSPDQLRELYSAKYFFGDEYANYVEDKRVLQKNFAARIRTLQRYSTGGKLFEIGCAYGFFLELAERLWCADGCDISADAVTYAREQGRRAECADILTLNRTAGSYDVVTMWDTIEHLARPDAYVKRASEFLKPGGHLCITTGDIGSLVARIRGRHWRLIHPPTHLFYFDRVSMTRLLETNGLRIVHFEHCGYYRSVSQIIYSLLVLNARSPARERLYRMLQPLIDFDFSMNLSDIMFVIARKDGA